MVKDYGGDRAAVFEVKYAKTLKWLEQECRNALTQIGSRSYVKDLGDDYSQVICYGISFYKKRCLIQKM